MAWTPPRTWSPGEFVTALMMNTHVRDNLLLLKTSISDDGLDWLGQIPDFLNSICDGRLTLTSGLPVTTGNVNSATTIYFTPAGRGNRIALFDGSLWRVVSFSECSLSLGSDAANTLFDVFAYLDGSGNVAIERLAWSSSGAGSSTRATALALQDGVRVLSGNATRRYLGTYRTTATVGQTEDSDSKRFVWNYYNRVDRRLSVGIATNSWTYSTPTWRPANNDASVRVEIVIGWAEEPVLITATAGVSNSVVGNGVSTFAAIGVGVNTTSSVTALRDILQAYPYLVNVLVPVRASGPVAVSAGYHYMAWLEYANQTNGGTFTWYRREPWAALFDMGLSGVMRG